MIKKLAVIFSVVFLTASLAYGAEKTAVKKAPVKTTVKKAAALPPVAVVSTSEAPVKKLITFKDLKKGPAYDFVMKMVNDYQVISGYPDGTFKGTKTINRAEFAKIVTNALDYVEKKYEISLADEPADSNVTFKDFKAKHWAYPFASKLIAKYKLFSGYPDGTFKPGKTINRFEMATVLSKTLRLIYDRCEVTMPQPSSKEVVALKDVKKNHWAMKDIQLMLYTKIMTATSANKLKYFKGNANVNRYDVAIAGVKLIKLSDSAIASLSAEKLAALRKKSAGPAAAALPDEKDLIAKSVVIPSKPQTSLAGGYGGVYEKGSATDNWRGLSLAGTYADKFSVLGLSGNYEMTGKYGYNQVVYTVPNSNGGGGLSASINNEHRLELEANTTYPVLDFYGIKGKVLLGAKHFYLRNESAPSSFTGFNAGVVSSAKIWDRDLLVKAFYSLPLIRTQLTPSVQGQPIQLFDYEASVNATVFDLPMLVGLTGETMLFSGGDNRYYNMLFARYFL
ncbi:MAG: S-layer homology domain-containing protein [Candidatus Margulisiibacteriota bacterium]|jgi:hypothetical protein